MHAVPLWTLAPFFGLLLAVAVLPLAAPHFWESNRNKAAVSLACGLPIALYLVLAHGAAGWADAGVVVPSSCRWRMARSIPSSGAFMSCTTRWVRLSRRDCERSRR